MVNACQIHIRGPKPRSSLITKQHVFYLFLSLLFIVFLRVRLKSTYFIENNVNKGMVFLQCVEAFSLIVVCFEGE